MRGLSLIGPTAFGFPTNKNIETLAKAFSDYKTANNETTQYIKNLKWGWKAVLGIITVVGLLVTLAINIKFLTHEYLAKASYVLFKKS